MASWLPALLSVACLLLTQHSAALPAPSRKLTRDSFCATDGATASRTWMNASRTCLKLYSSGAPIRAPDDTKTIRWGQVVLKVFGLETSTAVFIDRNRAQYPISPKANPPTDARELMQIWPLLVVRAEVANGTVMSFTVVLYVPDSTLMSTMAGTKFEGLLYNTEPRPTGPKPVSWFRWTFGDTVSVTNHVQKYGTILPGTFDNLFTPVKDPKGKCQPALCSDPTRKSDACKYYIRHFGTSSSMTLTWDPNMHLPVDTQLVPMFPATHRQYMAHFIQLHDLLRPYRFLPRTYRFTGHGNPMGVPLDFVGVLSQATETVPCKT